jgi:predicted porin
MTAQADATAYGQVQFEVANYDNGTESGIWVTDRQRGRFGVKGSHDLGGGLSSFAMIEFDLEGNANDSEFGGHGNANRIREVNAGLKGSWGTFTIGTLKSAYKYTGGVKYDPFVTTTLEARTNGGMTGGTMGQNGFINDALSYKNKFGNVGVWITYSPDKTQNDSNSLTAGDTNQHDGQYTAAIKYSVKSFEVFVAGSDAGGGTDTQYSSTKVGGQWRKGPHKISAQYEMSSDVGSGATGVDADTYFLGYQFKMGKSTLVAQLGNNDPDGADNATDYYALGAIYKFNKKTRVFAGYRSSDPEVGDTVSSLSAGLRVDF